MPITSASKPPTYLAIKNWAQYQCVDRKGRCIRLYVKDYCGKDMDDHEYAGLTFLQRYIWDACCRLRGRIGRNLFNDPVWISRAIGAIPKERHYVPAAISKLISCGFLVPTNQEVSLSDSDSDSDLDSDKPSLSKPSGSDKASSPVVKESQPKPSPEASRLVEKLKAEIQRNKPDFRVTPAQEHNWAVTAQRMLEIDQRKLEDVLTVIEWAQHDDFWRPNVLSMGKLREKFDQLQMKMKQPAAAKPSRHTSFESKDYTAGLRQNEDGTYGL